MLMPLLALPFPALNPVIVELGPFAIRWYALAYIAGILLGWLYARAIIKSRSAWGGPAPLTAADFDDFVLWVTLGIILGGRTGYVLFYNLPHFIAHPIEIPQLWKGGMSFHGGFIGCMLAVILFARGRGIPILSLGDLTCAVGPIGVFPGGGPLPRHPSQLYEVGLEGLVLFAVLAILIRAGALRRRGLIIGAFALGYGIARCIAELFREPDPQLGFLWGGLTMGMLLSVPMILAGLGFLFVALRRRPAAA